MSESKTELLKGTLDMLILQTLRRGSFHGYGIARWIEERTNDVLEIEEGSLYPALYRMERKGWIESEWGISDNNRRARYYRLTPEGEKQLREQISGWEKMVSAVGQVLQLTVATHLTVHAVVIALREQELEDKLVCLHSLV